MIREGQLRPVDLDRRGADVELVNLAHAERIVSKIADLNEAAVARAAIRELPTDAAWRDSFVATILDCLEKRHRDLGNGPAKALIGAPAAIRRGRRFRRAAASARQLGVVGIHATTSSIIADRGLLAKFGGMEVCVTGGRQLASSGTKRVDARLRCRSAENGD